MLFFISQKLYLKFAFWNSVGYNIVDHIIPGLPRRYVPRNDVVIVDFSYCFFHYGKI